MSEMRHTPEFEPPHSASQTAHAIAEGQSLLERRSCMELFCDTAADLFERHTGTPWRPRSGSMVSHRNMTAAMIDSRDYLAAKRKAEAQVMIPEGTKVALTGGADCNNHSFIWAKLDQVRAKHPDKARKLGIPVMKFNRAGGA